MKWSSWFLFALSLTLLFGVFAMVTRQSSTSAAEHYALVKKRLSQGVLDQDQALMNLDQCLRQAEDEGDEELAADVRRDRGQLLVDLGAFERGRADLAMVAERRPTDAGVARALVELELKAGAYESARKRIDASLAATPGSAVLWSTLARAWRLEAESNLKACDAEYARRFAAEDALVQRGRSRQAAAIAPDDARRPALYARLQADLEANGETDGARILKRLDVAAACHAAALEAAARAVELGADADALVLSMEIAAEARDFDRVVALGLAAEKVQGLRGDARRALLLLAALRSQERKLLSAELVQAWMPLRADWPAEFWRAACLALHEAGRHDALHGAAVGLRGSTGFLDMVEADFWLGLSLSRSGYCGDATRFFSGFLRVDDAVDPIPHARAIARRELAACARSAGRTGEELEHLRGVVQLWPEGDGEAWARLAQLSAEGDHGGWRLPVDQQARAIALMPARADELVAAWTEWGERHLQLVGFDANNPDEGERGPLGPSSYELHRRAQEWLRRGELPRAVAANRRLLAQLPTFLPALDLAIDLAQAQGGARAVAEAIAARVEVGGRTARTDAVLATLSSDSLPAKTRLALIKADPLHSGRLQIAEELLRRGRSDQALAGLEALAADSWTNEARLVAARLRLERGEAELAAELVLPAEAALDSTPGALELALDALAAANRSEDALALLQRHGAALAPKRALAICDSLLRRGEAASALLLASRLDARKETRGPEVLLRLLSCQLALGRVGPALETLQRLEAFDATGRSARLGILAALAAKDDGLLADQIDMLRPQAKRNPLLAAQLALLRLDADAAALELAKLPPEEVADRDPARHLASVAADLLRKRRPTQAQWFGVDDLRHARLHILGQGAPRDPREVVAWMLASQDALAAPALKRRLAQDGAAPTEAWDRWLWTKLLVQEGRVDAARASAELLVAGAPDFGPGWNLLRDIGLPRDADERAKARFALRRMEALGALACQAWERKLLEGVYQLLDGSAERALRLAEETLVEQPGSVRARRLAVLASAKLGDDARLVEEARPALSPRTDAIDALTTAERAELVQLVADRAVQLARGASPLAARHRSLYDDLAAASPDDPWCTLAAARLDLHVDPRTPAVGVARANGRLDRFRLAHRDRGLDELSTGSIAAWTAFHLECDPEQALCFLEAELAVQPAQLAPWIERPAVLGRLQRHAEAARAARLADDLAPGERMAREALRWSARGEMSEAAIEDALLDVPAREGTPGAEPEIVLLAADAYANIGPRGSAHAGQLVELLRPHLATRPAMRPEWVLVGLRAAAQAGGADAAGKAAAFAAEANSLGAALDQRLPRMLAGLARAGGVDS
jgi:hypothetical protein